MCRPHFAPVQINLQCTVSQPVLRLNKTTITAVGVGFLWLVTRLLVGLNLSPSPILLLLSIYLEWEKGKGSSRLRLTLTNNSQQCVCWSAIGRPRNYEQFVNCFVHIQCFQQHTHTHAHTHTHTYTHTHTHTAGTYFVPFIRRCHQCSQEGATHCTCLLHLRRVKAGPRSHNNTRQELSTELCPSACVGGCGSRQLVSLGDKLRTTLRVSVFCMKSWLMVYMYPSGKPAWCDWVGVAFCPRPRPLHLLA